MLGIVRTVTMTQSKPPVLQMNKQTKSPIKLAVIGGEKILVFQAGTLFFFKMTNWWDVREYNKTVR